MSDVAMGRIGEVIAERFELRAPLADAGLGEPWSAIDRAQSGRSALVKLLPPGGTALAPWSTVTARLRYLGNPRLPKLIDTGETSDGRRWIAMESVRGRSLANWLDGHAQAGTSPGLGVVLRLFDAVSSAVQVGHGAGARQSAVLHRGLSPRSVMLDAFAGGHHVVLLDHEVGPFADLGATWEYRAPEQAGRRGTETAASDVFALAVILVHLLGQRATPQAGLAETWSELVQRAPKQSKTALYGLRDDVPKALWDMIADALHPEPTKRVADAQVFARKLRQAVPPAWKKLPMVEHEPPMPVRTRDDGGAATRGRKQSASVPDGWQQAERRSLQPEVKVEAVRNVSGAGTDPPSGLRPAASVVATPARVADAEVAVALAGSRRASARVVTLLDEDDVPAWGATPTRDEAGPMLSDVEDAPAWRMGAAHDEGSATLTDYEDDDATEALSGSDVRLRAAAMMVALGRPAVVDGTRKRVGSETLPVDDLNAGSSQWNDPGGGAIAPGPRTARVALPVALGGAPDVMVPTSEMRAASGRESARLGTTGTGRVGGETIGLEEVEGGYGIVGEGGAGTLPLGPSWESLSPRGVVPHTLPMGHSRVEKTALIAPRVDQAMAWAGGHAHGAEPHTLPMGQMAMGPVAPIAHRVAGVAPSKGPGGDRAKGLGGVIDAPDVPQAVWIAVAIAAMLVIVAVGVVLFAK